MQYKRRGRSIIRIMRQNRQEDANAVYKCRDANLIRPKLQEDVIKQGIFFKRNKNRNKIRYLDIEIYSKVTLQ